MREDDGNGGVCEEVDVGGGGRCGCGEVGVGVGR